MQGKGSPTLNNPQGPLYVNTENSRRQGTLSNSFFVFFFNFCFICFVENFPLFLIVY